ncbi:endonuclease iv endodeoxyribonuclease iv [Anaeramoeba flamelloides]|uniref:Endonuclease iv endodeoxyribonuclease iv n=1 Tax=Anaeramoeba flamelloides TaxID=1746091 RepID=A0AAV7YNW5_9EUKA|nr:endonuclease iv endodeoxyribonuclease iv [Anaeramoeba flamelloides]
MNKKTETNCTTDEKKTDKSEEVRSFTKYTQNNILGRFENKKIQAGLEMINGLIQYNHIPTKVLWKKLEFFFFDDHPNSIYLQTYNLIERIIGHFNTKSISWIPKFDYIIQALKGILKRQNSEQLILSSNNHFYLYLKCVLTYFKKYRSENFQKGNKLLKKSFETYKLGNSKAESDFIENLIYLYFKKTSSFEYQQLACNFWIELYYFFEEGVDHFLSRITTYTKKLDFEEIEQLILDLDNVQFQVSILGWMIIEEFPIFEYQEKNNNKIKLRTRKEKLSDLELCRNFKDETLLFLQFILKNFSNLKVFLENSKNDSNLKKNVNPRKRLHESDEEVEKDDEKKESGKKKEKKEKKKKRGKNNKKKTKEKLDINLDENMGFQDDHINIQILVLSHMLKCWALVLPNDKKIDESIISSIKNELKGFETLIESISQLRSTLDKNPVAKYLQHLIILKVTTLEFLKKQQNNGLNKH